MIGHDLQDLNVASSTVLLEGVMQPCRALPAAGYLRANSRGDSCWSFPPGDEGRLERVQKALEELTGGDEGGGQPGVRWSYP